MTIHRDMYDKTNNKQDVKMENENEEQPGEDATEAITSPEEVAEKVDVEAETAQMLQEELVAALMAQAEQEEDAGIRAMGL